LLFRLVLFAAIPFPLHIGAIETDPELILLSYKHTYPHKIGRVAREYGDWIIEVNQELFYWAEGRLLPDIFRDKPEEWKPHSFSVYPAAALSPDTFSPEEVLEIRHQGSDEARSQIDERYNGFLAALYGGETRVELERQLVQTLFLGYQVVVHQEIAEALGRIDANINKAAETDSETAQFIASIASVGGYNWREIRGARSMSYHSWGLAVDIQPRELKNKVIYWLWEEPFNNDWMLVPLNRRWHPPETVIRAFENEGFIWGGKWTLYDNMHFEYRPELHEMNRLLAADGAAARIIKTTAETDLHHLFPVIKKPALQEAPSWEASPP
jgi:hypothetical protein